MPKSFAGGDHFDSQGIQDCPAQLRASACVMWRDPLVHKIVQAA